MQKSSGDEFTSKGPQLRVAAQPESARTPLKEDGDFPRLSAAAAGSPLEMTREEFSARLRYPRLALRADK